MADITLEPFGDRELRVVKLTLPSGDASIPVFVIFYRSADREFAKVAPAVGLYAQQASALAYHFSAYNEWKKEDHFLIDRKHLSKLTERVNGITPAYYYRWPGLETPAQTGEKLRINGEEVEPIPDDAQDFLEFVHKRRSIDRNVLRLAWTAVAREAATWMLKKRKPINLGFVTLHALPYRANWKEILLATFPNAWWWLKKNLKKEGGFENNLAEAEFMNYLTTVEMMAIHGRDHYVFWTMEAVPSKTWEDDAAELEMTRKAGGNTNYVRFYEETMARLSSRVVEVFKKYVEKTCRPFAAVRSGLRDGSVKLVPYTGKTDVLPAYGKNIPVRIVTPDGPPRLGAGDQFQPVSPKVIPGLQTMSTFPSANHAVRKSLEQGDVAESADGKYGTSGLPVPYASKGKTGWE